MMRPIIYSQFLCTNKTWKVKEEMEKKSFLTFQQDLPDFLHLQLLCTQGLLCPVRDSGHHWLHCSVYSRLCTAMKNNKEHAR